MISWIWYHEDQKKADPLPIHSAHFLVKYMSIAALNQYILKFLIIYSTDSDETHLYHEL